MAIIYSYPKNTNLLASDLLVGTSTAIVAGKKKNQTKSFSLGDLSNYVISNIPIGEIATLNQVLTAGNTSTLDAKIGKLYLYDIANIGYGRVQLSNNIFNITTASGDDLFSNEIGLSRVWNAIGVEGVINYTNLTGSRIYAMPNASGTIALTSDIPAQVIPNINEVLTAGNTSILNAKIGELYLWDGANEDYGKVNFIDGEFHVYDYTGDSIFWASRAGTMTLFNLAGKVATLDSSTITENRMYSLPNKSGLVALVQDIPTKTSDLINDGEDGINPFITAADIPTIPTSFGLYAQTALSTPIVFASGETSLIGTGVGTLTVPANAFKVGDSFVAKMCGRLTCANNEILHIRVRSNGVLIIDALQYTLATTTNKYYDLILDFTVTKIGAPGVSELFANGIFTYNKNASTAMEGVHFGQISNTAFNTTISNALTITAEWVTANVANTIQSQNFVLTKVY